MRAGTFVRRAHYNQLSLSSVVEVGVAMGYRSFDLEW
jgi:hypothetical protein